MTLSTSVTKTVSFRRAELVFFIISIFLMVVGAVYEYFSHGVYSYYMIYAFAIPLVFGCGACKINMAIKPKYQLSPWSFTMYCLTLATLTIWSIAKGALIIYGTDNELLMYYPIAAAVLLLASIIVYIVSINRITDQS